MFRNSRLLLSQWFFGSTGRQNQLPVSSAERLVFFTLFLILFCGLVWAVFQLLDLTYRRVLAECVELFYGSRGRQFEFRATETELVFRSFSRPTFEANLSTEGVVANLVFLLALILATPGMAWVNRCVRAALAVLILFFSHTLFLVTKVEVSLIVAKHPAAGSAGIWNVVDNFFEITGRVFFPVFIWLLLALPYMLGAVDSVDEQPPVRAVGRNAPCPCGSGKKYKRCCGR